MKYIKFVLSKLSNLSTLGKMGVVCISTASIITIGSGTYYMIEQWTRLNDIKEAEKEKKNILDSYTIKDNLVFEYGDSILLEPETFITVKEIDAYEDMRVILAPLYEEGKEYLSVGKHEGKVEYKNTSKEFMFEVKDTTAPTFTTFKETIELYASSEHTLEGLKTYFIAKDLSGVAEIEIHGAYDLAKVGSYDIKVSAKDKYGNIMSDEATITVKEKPKTPIHSNDKVIIDSSGKTPGYDTNGNGEIDRPSRDENALIKDDSTSKVCVPGEPNPEFIGNSGLLFYGDDAYYTWQNEFLQSDEYYAMEGFSSWPIMSDCMGNDISDQQIWTVEWW